MKSVLYSGILKVKSNIKSKTAQPYIITLLDEDELPSMVALQDVIISNLQRDDLLEPFSPDFLKKHLGRHGFVLGIFSGGKLVGFRNVYFPGSRDRKWNLGKNIGLRGAELTRVANLQLVCVHPHYRGNGLASKMNRIALGALRKQDTHEHICATVSPFNIWNLRILLDCGFHIKNLKLKYGGKMRYIVYQRLREPVAFHKAIAATVPLNDLGSQKRLLQEGLCGVDLKPPDKSKHSSKHLAANQWELVFRKPVQDPKVHVISHRPAKQIRIEPAPLPNNFGNHTAPGTRNDAFDCDEKE